MVATHGLFKLVQTEQTSFGCTDLLQLIFAISCLHCHCASLILTTVLLTQKCGLSLVSHMLVICMVLDGLLQARAEFALICVRVSCHRCLFS